MKNIILIDLDNTLVAIKDPHSEALRSATQGLSTVAVEKAMEKISLLKRCRPNDLTAEHVALHLQMILKSENEKYSLKDLHNKYEHYLEKFYDDLNVVEGAEEFLASASEMSLPIVVVTNNFLDISIKKIIATGLEQYITDIITPETYGIGKENKFLFRFILDDWKCDPSNAIMIGDNSLTDGGCRDLGIEYFHISDNNPSECFGRVNELIVRWGKQS